MISRYDGLLMRMSRCLDEDVLHADGEKSAHGEEDMALIYTRYHSAHLMHRQYLILSITH
jgi:hypothetical protein